MKADVGYLPLYEVKTRENPDQDLLTPSTECFLYILYENIHQKLENIRDSDNGWDTKVGNRKKGDEEQNKKIDGKWTGQAGGSCPFTSFNRVGVAKYNGMVTELKAMQADETKMARAAHIDALILSMYRELYDVVGDNKKDAAAVAKGKLTAEELRLTPSDYEEEIDEEADW